DCKYIALSYVWSESPSSTMPLSETMDMTELHEVPQVIKDCMDLAVSLGYRYVWCDRYCINQDDEEKKAAQIAQMDLIYAQAQITVIAAAPGDGLRGINGSQRRRQPGLRVNDWTVLSTLPHPAHTINASKWKTRGWTYQEGLLSVRRLIFGEHQVIFECNGISCAEASVYPLAKMLPEED
ncbi:HET-domain-containing protein, partial [Amniculicola lignicola CBS 123094]